jgi:ectoine hydroxylase-related dioxygenase (phytanoyl-CoA dioxygenase family)
MDELDQPFGIANRTRERFDSEGFVHLTGVLEPETLRAYGDHITQRVLAANPSPSSVADRSTYDRAFLQVMNLWRDDARVREFVFGQRLARVAADLMGVRGVRLYHDQALYKEPAGGFTPWHADQYYWPLASDRCCTAWIPLQRTSADMGPLAFSVGSHRADLNRDLPISDASEAEIQEQLDALTLPFANEPFDLGDVSFHQGWTFHRAGPNTTDLPRRVMTIIYMDVDMRLAEPANDDQELDKETWCPGVAIGEVIDSPLNPVLYSG